MAIVTNLVPTQEQEHIVMRKRVVYVPSQIIFKAGVNVILVNGVPMAQITENNPDDQLHGMTVLLDVESAIQRGLATAKTLGNL